MVRLPEDIVYFPVLGFNGLPSNSHEIWTGVLGSDVAEQENVTVPPTTNDTLSGPDTMLVFTIKYWIKHLQLHTFKLVRYSIFVSHRIRLLQQPCHLEQGCANARAWPQTFSSSEPIRATYPQIWFTPPRICPITKCVRRYIIITACRMYLTKCEVQLYL